MEIRTKNLGKASKPKEVAKATKNALEGLEYNTRVIKVAIFGLRIIHDNVRKFELGEF
jgi:hypothetical protein